MQLRNKDIEYREFSKSFPVRMPAVVLADVGNNRVLIVNGEGEVKLLNKNEFRVVS